MAVLMYWAQRGSMARNNFFTLRVYIASQNPRFMMLYLNKFTVKGKVRKWDCTMLSWKPGMQQVSWKCWPKSWIGHKNLPVHPMRVIQESKNSQNSTVPAWHLLEHLALITPAMTKKQGIRWAQTVARPCHVPSGEKQALHLNSQFS